MTKTSAPMSAWKCPLDTCDTTCQWTCLNVRMMNMTVRTPVMTVMTACIRMIRSKPMTPPTMINAAMMIIDTILTPSPPPQCSAVKTVDVASTAMTVRTVSQPTQSSHEMNDGRRLPRTPYAARLSTIVGAEPRLPAVAMMPQRTKLTMMPISATISACQNEMPKPRMYAP